MAMTCKQLQAEISRLMIDIEVGCMGGNFDPRVYRDQLRAIKDRADDTKDDVLRRPVLAGIRKQLVDAGKLLSGTTLSPRQVRLARVPLRAACNAL